MPRILIVLIAVLFVLAACEAEDSSPAASPAAPTGEATGSPATTASPAETAAATGEASGEVVEITVGTDTGTELIFDPAEVAVPAGAIVRLTFINQATVPHNLTFGDPINVATATIDPGAEETIEFTAPEAGEHPFVCTLHPGMEGTLIVEG